MAKQRKKLASATRAKDENQGVSYWGFANIDSNGVAPLSRVRTANDAYSICWNLLLDNAGRERKWSRIYKCYKGFPPREYSDLLAKGLNGTSNVPFRQMKFIIDNQKSSFVDMVMERNQAANIQTKIGNPTEKKEWSDLISLAFDRLLRYWPSYNYNVECDVEEMNLYGKGFEIAEDRDGWPTKSFHNSNVLIPDKTFADLSNLGELCLKRSYTALEFWHKITGGEDDPDKAREYATSMGWNFWACVDALRMFTTNYRNTYTNTEWLRDVASGNMNLSRLYTLRIEVYELYIMEFDGSISKMLLLQNYSGLVSGYRDGKNGISKDLTEEEYRKQCGFIYYKKDWVEKDGDGWEDIIAPITDSTGSGIWHEIQGLADAIFTQCRAYDLHMNRILESVDWNTRLMLEGGTADANKKMKQMEWTPWMVLPTDVKPAQVSIQVPFQEILGVINTYQADLYRGIGAYNIGQTTKGGKQRTKGEAELDAAESAKLQGTQIRRFNDNQTRWLRMLFKRLVNTTKGGNGYKLKQKFVDFLTENGVPKEAYAWENIEYIESNMLSGAGSPSFKLMAAQQTVSLAGMTAANDGQENAIQDAIAAVQGRQNVARYRQNQKIIIPDDARTIAMENSAMNDPRGNPENFRVFPSDHHIEHFKGHYSDTMTKLNTAKQILQQNSQSGNPQQNQSQPLPPQLMQTLQDIYNTTMHFNGPHMVAHLQFIQKDPTKKHEAKQFGMAMQQMQKLTDEVGSAIQQMMKAQQNQQAPQQGQSPEDIKLHALVAQKAIETKALSDKENIKTAAAATRAHLHEQGMIQKTATDVAIKRAKSANDMQIDQQESQVKQMTAQDESLQQQEIAAQEAITEQQIKSQENQSND